MNEALELAILCEEHMPSPDACLRIGTMLRSQVNEIGLLKEEVVTWKVCYDRTSDSARDLDAMLKSVRIENQKLRKALESVSNMSEELSISRFARAALGEKT